ncbi:MAG TPA: hypothetical protein RMH99_12685 [Sandaracinaceae bacterium LLY-WYZ-13_1]|nr:hypothetical protein [Sandaracinaceae bacterium LLY-WYZ-13_1]
MRGWTWTSVAVAAVAWAAGGCETGPEAACVSAMECARGMRCVEGRCAPPDGDPGDDAGRPVEIDAGPVARVDAGEADGAYECATATFELTETQEAVIVPAGVRYVHVAAWGAGGNGEGGCEPTDDGGPGGFTEAVFAVTPGDALTVIVGKRGRAGTSGEDPFRFGFGAWGGGGLSGVFWGGDPVTEADRDRALVIAGGGGSASVPGCHPGGPGNHPSAGGQDTMHGAFGGSDSIIGGGGGYAGGDGGDREVAAAGGSGYVDDAAIDARILHAEPAAGALPPAADHPDYVEGVGTTEQSGHVVIHYLCEPVSLI